MLKEQVDAFIAKWGGPKLDFPAVPYRKDGGATFSTEFGIDDSTKELFAIRVHLGNDRRVGTYGKIYAPFDANVKVEIDPNMYGTLTRLTSYDEFEIRIAHMTLEKNLVLVNKLTKVKQGDLLGDVGAFGKTAGAHTHTELVSLDGASELCEEILRRKGFKITFFTDDELKAMCGTPELYKALKDDMTNKAITAVGPHIVKKWDKWTQKPQTYYDPRAVFAI